MRLHYAHVLDYVVSHPWAILPEKAAIIRDILLLRASGLTLSDEEIRARVGGSRETPQARTQETIAIVPVFGSIAHRMNMFSDISGGTSTEQLAAQLRALGADPNITSVVLDVNSPGGSVMGMTELAAEIRDLRAKKPVIAVANALMASAAYWLAASASEIVALPSAQVGSIGVFSMHEDVSKALDEKGVKVTLISAGKFKTEGNPFEPLSDDAKAAVQGTVDFYYGQFISDVAKGRGVAADSVRAGFGEGRVVTAKDALKLGMIDRVGTLDDVVGDLLRGKAPQGQRASVLADAEALREPVADVQTPVGEMQTAVASLPLAADGTPEAWMADLELRKMKLRILELDE